MVMLWLHTFAAQCSYMKIVKNQLPEVLTSIARLGDCVKLDQKENLDAVMVTENQVWWTDGNNIFTLVLLSIVLPLCTLKKIDFLGYTSGLAMACMVVFSVVIIYLYYQIDCPFKAPEMLTQFETSMVCAFDHHNISSAESNSKGYSDFITKVSNESDLSICETAAFGSPNLQFLSSICVLLFAFQCHASMLPIYSELKGGNRKLMLRVGYISIGSVFAMYFITGLFGYLTWRTTTMGDVLLAYTHTNPKSYAVILVRICSLICVILSAPLLHFPCRKTLLTIIQGPNFSFSWFWHLGAMAFNLVLVFICVSYVESLSQIFTYAGALTASSLICLLPSLMFIFLTKDKPEFDNRRRTCYFLALLGLIFIPVALGLQINTDFFSNSSS